MPLVKRPSGSAAPPHAVSADPFRQLADPDPDARWSAARALATEPEAAGALGRALEREADARVREAITTTLMRIGSEAAAGELIPRLRSDDAALRSLVVEALQGMPVVMSAHLPDLLADPDADVRLLAAEIARTMPAVEGTAFLADALAGEQHPNVAAGIVEVLAEIGTPEAADALRIARRRFAAEPFLPFAVDVALERLGQVEP